MGIALPQLAPASEDRVSGALVAGGCVKFDGNKNQYLKRNFIAGNRTKSTFSAWVKRSKTSTNNNNQTLFEANGGNGDNTYLQIKWRNSTVVDSLNVAGWNTNFRITSRVFRDYSAWYHIVVTLNTSDTAPHRIRIYINGEALDNSDFQTNNAPSGDMGPNGAYTHYIGAGIGNGGQYADFYMTQTTFIDGLALGPEYFAYTDPLTGVWRPKKFKAEGTTINDGTQWSSGGGSGLYSGSTWGPTFDGTPASTGSDVAQSAYVSNSGTSTVTFSKPIDGVLRFRACQGSNSASTGSARPFVTLSDGQEIRVDGANNAPSDHSFGYVSGITSLTITGTSSQGMNLLSVTVDGVLMIDSTTQNLQFGANGFYLPMDGNSPIGEDQAPSPNDGTVWSSGWSGTNMSGYNKEESFDGITNTNGNNATRAEVNQTLTWTNPKTSTPFTTLRLWAADDGSTIRVNGVDVSGQIGAGYAGVQFFTITGVGSALETIELVGGSGVAPFLWAVEIDGTILIDGQKGNSWTPVNFGGSTIPEKATGAKPILNTGNGGNVARPGVFGSEVSAFYETTSASNSGGQYYFSHDSSAKPTFSFVRGATYTFDYSASSSHPLRFATAADAAGNTEYTDGTSISGNVIKFTVPHNAPDTLYYYCNVHNGMGNSISVTTDLTKADPYAWKCILAMPMISEHDVSGDMNCTTTNDSITNNSVAFNNDQSVFYNQSADPDGSQYFSGVDLSSWNTEQPWTVEFWWYRTGANTNNHGHFVGGTIDGTNQYGPTYRDGSHNDWQFNFKGQSIVITPSPALQTNKWEHHAFTSDGNNITYFRDGVFQTTASASSMTGTWGSSNEIFRGGAGWSSQYVVGHVCDMRVYAGVEKYTTAGFIPASTNPDIVPDTPSGVALKTKLKKITDGAVSFDGTGDYLSTAYSSSDFTFGTGDFTIEMFLYNRETGGKGFIQFSDSSGGLKNTSSGVVTIHKDGSSHVFRAYVKNASTAFSTVVPYKRWCHVALVRESGTIKLFVDGKQDATTVSNDTTDYATTYAAIGGYYDTSYLSDCIISNVRVNKGTALYTSDFIPPTEPLTNVTNTKLLTCQTSTTYQIAAVAPLVSGVNNGTVWSSSVTSGSLFRSGFPATYAFNGTTKSNTNQCAATPQSTGQGFAFTFGEGVPFTTLQMQCDDNNGGLVFVNGVDITSQLPTGSLTNTTITGVTSPLTSIRLISTAGDALYLGSVTIDGTMLVDPLTPNGDAVTTNFNPFNTDINTVRGQEGAYATLDPLDHRSFTDGPSYVLSDGNLTCDLTGGTARASKSRGLVSSNMDIPLGKKIYCEFDHPYLYNDDYALGITSQLVRGYYETGGNVKPGAYLLRVNGIFYSPAEQLGASTDRAFTGGDTIGIAVDLESAYKTITWYKNGEKLFNYQIDIDQGPFKFSAGIDPGSNAATYKIHVNFGQKPFKYTPPEGFQALTSSMIKPDIALPRPDKFIKATTYVGSGAVQDVNVGFKPDLIWVKDRDDTNNHNNNLIDSVNGAPNLWMSDNPTALVTNSTDGLTAITSNGFTLGANTAGTQSYELNKSGNGYIAWTWKAGGNEGTFNIDDADMGSAANAKMSIGSLNDVAYDQSQRWRDNITSSNGWNTSYPVNNIFNGSFDGGGGAANNGNGGVVTFTPPAAITVTKLELSIYNDVTLTLPDGTTQELIGVGSADRYVEADIGSGFSFTGSNSITISRTGGFIYLERIKINGKELVDNDITPTNVPSIAATACSVGTKQGFSIIKYAGGGSGSANSNSNKGVPHGLGEAPDFIIGKNLNTTNAPMVYHSGLPSGTINLSSTNGNDTSSFIWAKKRPSKHEVFLGNNPEINGSNNYILYCWHNISGLQKFGTYDGISSSNGTVIDLGFRPRILLLKRYSSDHSNAGWHWYDTARDTVNPARNFILADKPYTERRAANNTAHIGTYYVDFLANGFKLRHNSTNLNDGSVKYLYAAWAEQPAFNLYGAQSNAH